MPGPITIVLADDHTLIRGGLRMLLGTHPDLEVVGEASDIPSVFRQLRGLRPAVLLLDLHMPGGSSLEAIPRLMALSTGTAIVVLTMDDDPALVREATAAGARAFLVKDAAEADLVRTIRRVAGS